MRGPQPPPQTALAPIPATTFPSRETWVPLGSGTSTTYASTICPCVAV